MSSYSEISTLINELSNKNAPNSVTPQTLTAIQSRLLDYTRLVEDTAAPFESGTVLASELYAWYTRDQGINCTIEQATYNIIGDYCFISLKNMMVPQGWGVVYYSLPVQCTIPSHGFFKSAVKNQQLYWSIALEPSAQVNVLRIAAVDDSGMQASSTSLIISYKCK